RYDSCAIHLRSEESQGPKGSHYRYASGHIVFHLLHAVGGLKADTTRVESYALSYVGKQARRVGIAFIFQYDETRCFLTALTHAKQCAHLQLSNTLLIQDLRRESGIRCHLSGALRNDAWWFSIRWFIDQLTCPIYGVPYDAAFQDRV